MKKLIVFAVLFAAAINISFAQVKMSKEAPTMRAEKMEKGKKLDRIVTAMESAGVPLNVDQISRLESVFNGQKEQAKALKADESISDEVKKEKRKEFRKIAQSQTEAILSTEQMDVMKSMKNNRGGAGKTKGIKPSKGKANAGERAGNKLEKITSTLETAGVPLDRMQVTQLTSLFNEEASELKAAETAYKSEMAVKDAKKNIRTTYKAKAKEIFTKEQSKALKQLRKAKKVKK